MLYILLTIIAIGVLLCSEAGKSLLKFFFIAACIGTGLYVFYWMVIFAIGIFVDRSFRDDVVPIIGFIMLAFMCIYYAYEARKKFKSGEFSIKKARDFVVIGTKKHPILAFFLVSSFVFTLYTLLTVQ